MAVGQGIQQECMGLTGLLQHGKRACVPGTSWCTCQNTHACTVCVCAYVCACMCVRAHTENTGIVRSADNLCLTGVNWGSLTGWPGAPTLGALILKDPVLGRV